MWVSVLYNIFNIVRLGQVFIYKCKKRWPWGGEIINRKKTKSTRLVCTRVYVQYIILTYYECYMCIDRRDPRTRVDAWRPCVQRV